MQSHAVACCSGPCIYCGLPIRFGQEESHKKKCRGVKPNLPGNEPEHKPVPGNQRCDALNDQIYVHAHAIHQSTFTTSQPQNEAPSHKGAFFIASALYETANDVFRCTRCATTSDRGSIRRLCQGQVSHIVRLAEARTDQRQNACTM